MSSEGVVPKHGHLWLTQEQQEEWVAAKKQVPTLIFASFVAFNALAGLALKIVNRKGLVTHPKNKALLQYGCAWQTQRWEVAIAQLRLVHLPVLRRRLPPPPAAAAAACCAPAPAEFDPPAHPASSRHPPCSMVSATYAVLSLAASVYLMVRRDLSHCGQQVFCVDDMSGRLLDFRAGWALFEILFWQNHSTVVHPWKEMVFLHNVVMIMQSVAARVSVAALCRGMRVCIAGGCVAHCGCAQRVAAGLLAT
jgi:hypothetical protein